MIAHELVPDSLRATFGAFPSGIVALCASVDDAPVGMAASTFVPVSLDPPLVAVCIQRTSRTWPVLRSVPSIGLSVLGSDHAVAARRLAARQGDRFAGLATTTTGTGAVHIDGCPAWLECAIHDEVDGGDHLIAVLRVLTLASDADRDPLVFHRSRFCTLHGS